MDILTIDFAETWFVLLGRSSFRAFGFTSVEVTKKKTSSKNTMSVIEDMLNDESTLDLRLIAIIVLIYLRVRAKDP